jgi:hypothetical protein
MNEEDEFSSEAYLKEFNKLHEEEYLSEEDMGLMEDDYIFEFDTDEEDEEYFQESFKKKAKW